MSQRWFVCYFILSAINHLLFVALRDLFGHKILRYSNYQSFWMQALPFFFFHRFTTITVWPYVMAALYGKFRTRTNKTPETACKEWEQNEKKFWLCSKTLNLRCLAWWPIIGIMYAGPHRLLRLKGESKREREEWPFILLWRKPGIDGHQSWK